MSIMIKPKRVLHGIAVSGLTGLIAVSCSNSETRFSDRSIVDAQVGVNYIVSSAPPDENDEQCPLATIDDLNDALEEREAFVIELAGGSDEGDDVLEVYCTSFGDEDDQLSILIEAADIGANDQIPDLEVGAQADYAVQDRSTNLPGSVVAGCLSDAEEQANGEDFDACAEFWRSGDFVFAVVIAGQGIEREELAELVHGLLDHLAPTVIERLGGANDAS